MKIVILDAYTTNPGDLSWERFKEFGELTVYDRGIKNDLQESIDRIQDADVVLTNKVPIKEELLEACPNIKYIGTLSTGYNIIDLDACRTRGIPVCNVPSYSTSAVAQFTMALLLEVCHHVGEHNNIVHSGGWERSVDFCFWNYPLIELSSKTIGIIGFGKIGQEVAKLAAAFGMKVLAYSRTEYEEGRKLAEYVDLDTMLASSDIVSLHCPLFPETRGIINNEKIAKMKDGAILLNTSRGPLIVEEDVANALNSDKLYYYATDVASREPIRSDNPLLTAKNCIITPHIAWAAKETRERLVGIVYENLKAYTEGKVQNNVAK
jgi:glycerate dehydrogenase